MPTGEKMDWLCKVEKATNKENGYWVWVKTAWIDTHPSKCKCFVKVKSKRNNLYDKIKKETKKLKRLRKKGIFNPLTE